jgi:AraC-like DNA-binding protein
MHAKQLLAAGVPPSDVAPQVGLYDQSQLNRHFRRIVGTTPGRYARGQ